jgi:predicted MFS family arabinose efflux permease
MPELLSAVPSLERVSVAGQSFAPWKYVYVGLLMVGVFGQYAAGKLTDRLRPAKGILVGFTALAVVAVLFVPAVGFGAVAVLVVASLLGFFLFFVQPFYQAAVAEHTPVEARGLSYGFTYLGVFGVGALGAVVAGAMLTYFSAELLFGSLSAVALCAALFGGYLLTRGPTTTAGQ